MLSDPLLTDLLAKYTASLDTDETYTLLSRDLQLVKYQWPGIAPL